MYQILYDDCLGRGIRALTLPVFTCNLQYSCIIKKNKDIFKLVSFFVCVFLSTHHEVITPSANFRADCSQSSQVSKTLPFSPSVAATTWSEPPVYGPWLSTQTALSEVNLRG